jgi:hypothetical protein
MYVFASEANPTHGHEVTEAIILEHLPCDFSVMRISSILDYMRPCVT